MARPERRDVDYFPFYAKRGKTLNILQKKFGLEGIGFFTNLLRFLSLTPDHYYCIADEIDMMNFFAEIGIEDESKGIEMIELMVKTAKFDKELWENHRVIASEDFLSSISDAYKRRSSEVITINEIREKFISTEEDSDNEQEIPTVSELPSSSNDNNPDTYEFLSENKDNNQQATGLLYQKNDNNPQSIVKYSKVKKSKLNNSSGGSEFLERLDTSPPPQNFIQKIKSLAIRVGFAIDDELAKHLSSGAYKLDWFDSNDFSFLHFVYLRITTSSKYSKLEVAEQRSLLFSALWNRNGKWSDLLDEYPVWHDTKLTEQQNIIKQKAKLKSKPVTCECGQALGASGKCSACGSWFEWQDNAWHFIQGISFSGNLFDQITKSHIPKISADEFPEEIDF